MNKFDKFRKKYPNCIYHGYDILQLEDGSIKIIYNFEIEHLEIFNPNLIIPKHIIKGNINEKFLNILVFNLGMVELISYYKLTCSPNIIVECGFLDNEQIDFFKKLYYLGLGEFLYINNIKTNKDELVNIIVNCKKNEDIVIDYKGEGNLIPVGGGKDSCVTLELLKSMNNTCFVINPKKANLECIEVSELDSICVKRTLDKKMLKLNENGFFNGHTPFSAIVAFTSFLVAYLSNKKYIVLSNEGSANEETVIGTNVNHQYSKTYEFECDFNNYTRKYFGIDIHYFSFLRPISEFQIGMIFSNYKKYHKVFKSCNVGSKYEDWNWCCNCAKCLFVYIILSPFLNKNELIDIFGEDLFDKKELLEVFLELLGYKETKPFECVGTYNECRYAVSLAISKSKELPYLLKYYKENYSLCDNFENSYSNENNLPKEFASILKGELMKYDK